MEGSRANFRVCLDSFAITSVHLQSIRSASVNYTKLTSNTLAGATLFPHKFICNFQNIAHKCLAMTTNGEKQASPKHPRVTDHIASAKRRRFRRLKSAPLADSFTYDKKTDAVKQCPKSVFDQFSPSYWKIGVVLLVYLAAGTLCFHLTRHQIAGNKTNSVLDALYFTVVTMTSVGYGDVIPDSTLTILLACLFVVLGMLIVGLVLGKAAEVLVVKQERILEKALHLHETIGEAQILKKMKTNTARNKNRSVT
uniref:Putative potassium channel domain-containing protein n=1 Tax=Helianthus annuus TaxID=4232 RepID=A0A251V7P4_HELAN